MSAHRARGLRSLLRASGNSKQTGNRVPRLTLREGIQELDGVFILGPAGAAENSPGLLEHFPRGGLRSDDAKSSQSQWVGGCLSQGNAIRMMLCKRLTT